MKYVEVNGVKCVEIPPPTENDILFFGLKRSGNHAILTWVLSHLETYRHYNNVFIMDGKCYVDFVSDINLSDDHPYSVNLYSFEDRVVFSNVNPLLDWSGLPSKQRIMIIRDPYNMYASRLQVHRNPNKDYPLLVKYWTAWTEAMNLDLWLSFAKEFTGETNHLGSDCIKVNYNTWLENERYRNELSLKHFGVVGEISKTTHKAGGGSSFEKLDGKPDKERLTNRWRHFLIDSEFSPLLRNREIARLSKTIFGFAHSQVRL